MQAIKSFWSRLNVTAHELKVLQARRESVEANDKNRALRRELIQIAAEYRTWLAENKTWRCTESFERFFSERYGAGASALALSLASTIDIAVNRDIDYYIKEFGDPAVSELKNILTQKSRG